MKNFVEISEYESIMVAGGRDSNVARIVELIGYGLGSLCRMLGRLGRKGQQTLMYRVSIGDPMLAKF